MSLTDLMEATGRRQWARAGLVLWAWLCAANFVMLVLVACGAALAQRWGFAAYETFAACGWLWWMLRAAAKASR